MNYGRAEDVKVPTVFERFLNAKGPDRGRIRDEIVEMVGRSGLFDVDDLIQLMKVGYRLLLKPERDEFMRRVLFELKKSEHP
jgi:hypothetical protein